MGEEVNHEKDASNFLLTLKFPFIPSPASATLDSPDHPSLQTLASVPFKWEEQPGKPRPCTDIIALPEPSRIILEPPPCRSRVTKMPSPTTVLDGPYTVGRSKFSSFRFLRESFDSTTSSSDSPHSSADQLLLGGGQRRKGVFGRGILGISSSTDEGNKKKKKMMMMMRRNGSFSSLSQPTSPRICATMYERIKHIVVPWKCTNKSKMGSSL